MNIIQNAIKVVTKDGEYKFLRSLTVHDFCVEQCLDGVVRGVDGGLDYFKSSGLDTGRGIHWWDYSLTTDNSIEEIKEKYLFFNQKTEEVLPLKDASDNHLKTIISGGYEPFYRYLCKRIQLDRKEE